MLQSANAGYKCKKLHENFVLSGQEALIQGDTQTPYINEFAVNISDQQRSAVLQSTTSVQSAGS